MYPHHQQQHPQELHGASAPEGAELLAELARVRHEKCEATGLVQILQSKLAQAQEENFDLRANMVTLEAETKYFTEKSQQTMQTKLNSLESQLLFMQQQLQQAERARVMAIKEKELAIQKQLVECKRLEAEKKLLQTRKRHQEQAFLMASQSMRTPTAPRNPPPTPMTTSTPTRTGASQFQRKSVTNSSSQFLPSSGEVAIAAAGFSQSPTTSFSPQSSQTPSPKRSLVSPTPMRSVASLGVQTDTIEIAANAPTESTCQSALTQANAETVATLMNYYPQELFALLNGGLVAASASNSAVTNHIRHHRSGLSEESTAGAAPTRRVASTFVGETQLSVQRSLPVSTSSNTQTILSQLVSSHAGAGMGGARSGTSTGSARRQRVSSFSGASRFGTRSQEKNLQQDVFPDEWAMASELFETLRVMLRGQASSTALVPVFIKYLTLGPMNKLPDELLSSVLKVLFFFMNRSDDFRKWIEGSCNEPADRTGMFAVPTNAHGDSIARTSHLRISSENKNNALKLLPLGQLVAVLTNDSKGSCIDHSAEAGTSMDQAKALVDAEQAVTAARERADLLHAVCRVIQNYEHAVQVVENGLWVLSAWIELCCCKYRLCQDKYSYSQPHSGVSSRVSSVEHLVASHVLEQVLLAPKSSFRVKGVALQVLVQLLEAIPESFDAFEAYANQHLLLNRLIHMLSLDPRAISNQEDQLSLRLLQLYIVNAVWMLLTTFTTRGLRLVMQSKSGNGLQQQQPQHSLVFCLVHVLDRESWSARSTGQDSIFSTLNSAQLQDKTKEMGEDAEVRVGLMQEAFVLLSFLVRFVDLSMELETLQQEETLLSVLVFLRSGVVNLPTSDFISKTAALLLSMVSEGSSSSGK